MNDRMSELYAEACLYSREYTKGGDIPEFIGRMAEKFSQLIVQECINQCTLIEEDDDLANDSMTLAKNNKEAFRDGAMMCRDSIMDYFGEVEE